jgi:hypothetical protein
MHTAQALSNVPRARGTRSAHLVCEDLLDPISGAHKPPARRRPAGLSQTAPARVLRPLTSARSAQGVDPRFSGNTTGTSALVRVGSCCNPDPVHYRAAFACSRILYPQPHRLLLRVAFPDGRATGLPRCVAETRVGRVPPLRRWRVICVGEVRGRPPGPRTILVQAYQHLWLVLIDGAWSGSPGLTRPRTPGPRPP